MSKVGEAFKVQPVRNKYHVQIWNNARQSWVDYFGHKYKCRIEADRARDEIIKSFK